MNIESKLKEILLESIVCNKNFFPVVNYPNNVWKYFDKLLFI